jgi:transposase
MCRGFKTDVRNAENAGKYSEKRALLAARPKALSHKSIERVAICSVRWQRALAQHCIVTRGDVVQQGSRLTTITLTDEEAGQLRRWARARHTARALALRARIVLACRAGRSNREVARRLAITTQTVGKWRARFVARRLEGLLDQPRSGAPRSISDELVEAVLAKTLHERPPDGPRWSSRRLASALGISQRAVLRIWRTFEL